MVIPKLLCHKGYSLNMPNLVGQTLLNQFRVDAFIASGSMGDVYRVWDLQRNVPLAVKVLHDKYAGDSTALEYLQQEAWALKALEHPNIVRFYGLYRSSSSYFLVEDFVNGCSLKQILESRDGKPFTLDDVISYYKGICTALHYAHLKGIIHCDIKPGNVLVDSDGKVYLADFSIANITGAKSISPGWVGTPAYMAPEQIQSAKSFPPTDVYALGIMLFELLSGGIRPFSGKQITGDRTDYALLQHAHLYASPPSLRAYNPMAAPEVEKIILRCLEKQPQYRYPHPMALLDDLTQVQSGLSGQKQAGKPQRTVEKKEDAQKVAPVNNRSRNWIWPVLIAMGVLVTLFFLMLNPPSSGSVPTPFLTDGRSVVKIPTVTLVRPTPYRPTPTLGIPTPVPTTPVVIQKFFPVYACMVVSLGGINRVDECVTGITILTDGRMQYDFTWSATLESGMDIKIAPDTSGNMYLTDNLGHRYDYLHKGGASAQSLVLMNGQAATGWFLFPQADNNATQFVFHDADNSIQTSPIARQWP